LRRRKKKPVGRSIIILAAIVMINFAGVSYASLNDKLQITNSITAGSIKPYFKVDIGNSGNYIEANSNENKNSLVGTVCGNEMNVGGELLLGASKSISYHVANEGTVPMKFQGMESTMDGGGLQFNVNTQNNSFNEVEDGVLNIKGVEPGVYNFKIELLYKQWNK
jgi:predicted ribosomally synthesized peptide with SipW-like signal peptide